MESAAPSFDLEIGLTLAVTAVALGLFAWNRLRLEVVGLLVMLSLPLLGLLMTIVATWAISLVFPF